MYYFICDSNNILVNMVFNNRVSHSKPTSPLTLNPKPSHVCLSHQYISILVLDKLYLVHIMDLTLIFLYKFL